MTDPKIPLDLTVDDNTQTGMNVPDDPGTDVSMGAVGFIDDSPALDTTPPQTSPVDTSMS